MQQTGPSSPRTCLHTSFYKLVMLALKRRVSRLSSSRALSARSAQYFTSGSFVSSEHRAPYLAQAALFCGQRSMSRRNSPARRFRGRPWNIRIHAGLRRFERHSHSIVAGGLDVMSYTTRLMPRTSLTILVDIRSRSSQGRWNQSAVIKSLVCTARSARVWS